MSEIKSQDKLRLSIFFLGLFMASMLFQTGSNRMGTLVAFSLISLIVLFYFLENGPVIRMGRIGVLLLLFLLISTIITLFRTELPPYYMKLVAQMVVFILMLSNRRVNQREENYLISVFVLSSVFFALVAIAERMTSAVPSYQRTIFLFGTEIDPNFFGIPIAASATILMHRFVSAKKHRLLFALGYFIFIVAILITASRSNFLVVALGSVFVFINFVKSRQLSFSKKIMLIGILLVALLLLYMYVQDNFSSAWERMTSIGTDGSDNGRFDLWRRAFNSWLTYPVFGGGLYYSFSTYGSASHNTYLQVLSETGMFGMCIYLFILLFILKKALKYNNIYGFILIPMMVQIAFLDALDNRCVWAILCWMAAVLPIIPSENTKTHTARKAERAY